MIALAQAGLVLIISLIRLQWAVCIFVFFLAFSPRSLGLVLGGGGVSLTFARIALPLLLLFYLAPRFIVGRVFDDRKCWRSFTIPFAFLALLSAWKILATIGNGAPLVYALDDVLFSVGVMFFFFMLSTRVLLADVLRALTLAGLITIGLVYVEFIMARPLHYAFVNSALFEEDALVGRVRDGVYRVQGIFDNPLSLAEFFVYLMPVILYRFSGARGQYRALLAVGLAALFVALWLTGSRGGLLVALLVCSVYWLLSYWRFFSGNTKAFSVFLIVVLLVHVTYFAVGFIYEKGLVAQSVSFYRLDDVEKSTYSRALQYFEVFSVLRDNPFFGLGLQQNFAKEFEEIRRIDNYYLRVGLEAGVVGILLFVGFIVSLYLSVHAAGSRYDSPDAHAFRAMAIALVVGFSGIKLFLSMPTNNVYFFAVMGLVTGYYARLRNAEVVDRYANPSGS